MVNPLKSIHVQGAREHNLQDISIEIPRDSLIVFTGLSGSGKSSLAFDTIYAEGQRRYVESLSAYARQFLEMMQKPDVDQIDGLSPAISIEQKTTSRNPRSTVGTVTEIYDYLRLLFARVGTAYSPVTGLPIESQTVTQMANDKQTNLQDTFLNHIRKNKVPSTVFLVNGVKLQGVVTWFDNFCVLLRRDGMSQLVYKHAISTIMPGQQISLYEGGDD